MKNDTPATTTYYVATLARYVLVDAADEREARSKGEAALRELGAAAPADIRTIRPATPDEIEFAAWHADALAREAARTRDRG
ncbi:MAG: hypothetical protein WED34_22105 [Planctomycetales bacterium]